MRTEALRPMSLGATVGLTALALTASLVSAGTSAAQETTASDSGGEPPRMTWNPNDPRVGLEGGWRDAASAILNLEHVAHMNRPEGFFDADAVGDSPRWNTDLAFQGEYLFQGSYHGFQIWNVAQPGDPQLRTAVVCPGGQGDVSVYGDLLFMSAQETRGRLDCDTQGVADSISVERFRGVRVFDISDLDRPRQVAAVQSCRGSHTHTLVPHPEDPDNVYVYIQGTSDPRPPEELAGCSGAPPEENPNTSLFRIEVVRVPLVAPQEAEIVNTPRIFADPETGDIASLWQGGTHGPGTQETSETNRCHDITVYPAMDLAGGACSGNGILLDISDPVNPVRIDEVQDPNFAYWHSATFNNDASKLVFTDEWGGGSAARCRVTDPPKWGANAIFTVEDGEMSMAGFYKLPVPQTDTENCVAHNGSIIPVPGRDLMIQAWYQGGLSLMDFTDPANPTEIAFFDRGPVDGEIQTCGFWSTYWYNGLIYGAEICRGVDVFRLTPSEHLSEAEIAAAELVRMERFNAQTQPRIEWPDAPEVARAYLDQLVRMNRILDERAEDVGRVLERAEAGTASAAELNAIAEELEDDVRAIQAGESGGDAERMSKLAEVLRGMEM